MCLARYPWPKGPGGVQCRWGAVHRSMRTHIGRSAYLWPLPNATVPKLHCFRAGNRTAIGGLRAFGCPKAPTPCGNDSAQQGPPRLHLPGGKAPRPAVLLAPTMLLVIGMCERCFINGQWHGGPVHISLLAAPIHKTPGRANQAHTLARRV